MASLSKCYLACYATRCSSCVRDHHHDPMKQKLIKINRNGTRSLAAMKLESLSHKNGIVSRTAVAALGAEDGCYPGEPFEYRQIVVIRSCEVGPDKVATVESILNLLQETALNHVRMSGHLADGGFGATHGMMRNNLIWVVTRMQVEVDRYPIWDEVIEIDTWVGASRKNNRMRRDWLIRNHDSGLVLACATSTWLMMNKQTRRPSKMPEEVRAEIFPWFIEKQAIKEDVNEEIEKLDDDAKYKSTDFKNIPDEFLENHQMSGMIVEYKRECGTSDTVQSLREPEGVLECSDEGPFRYTHLLQTKGEAKNEEIARGRTSWKKKSSTMPFST